MTGPPGVRTGRTSIFATTPLPVGMQQMTANLQAQANHRAAAAAAAANNNNNNHYSYAQDPNNNSNVYFPHMATQDGQQGGGASNMRGGPPSAREMAQFDAESEEQVDGQDDELSNDPRKRRRMLANRESARRSRRRKQEHVDKLEEAQLSAPGGSSVEPTPTNVKSHHLPELISSSGSEGRSDGRQAEASRFSRHATNAHATTMESVGVNRWDSLLTPEEGDQPQYQTVGVKDIMESAFEEQSGGEAAN
eukprot:jgi/Chlat1/7269/Chrsp58S06875